MPSLSNSIAKTNRNPVGVVALVLCAVFTHGAVHAQSPQIFLPTPQPSFSIDIEASELAGWREGEFEVLYGSGGVAITQGPRRMTAERAVVWLDRSPTPRSTTGRSPEANDRPVEDKVIVYLEGGVQIEHAGSNSATHTAPTGEGTAGATVDRMHTDSWFGRLFTDSHIYLSHELDVIVPESAYETWQRAQWSWEQDGETIRQAQSAIQADPYTNQSILISPQTGQVMRGPTPTTSLDRDGPFLPATFQSLDGPSQPDRSGAAVPVQRGPIVSSRVRITPRHATTGAGIRSQATGVPGETVVTATGGVRVIIDSDEIAELDLPGPNDTRQILIEADQVVAWTNQLGGTTPADAPPQWEIYLEGNVQFVMGNRVVYAERMFYDAMARRGTILEVEMLTPVPNFRGLARLRADVVQQLNDNQWQAFGAALTSSRMGVPRYWLQSGQLDIDRRESAPIDPLTRLPQFDPATGQPLIEEEYFADSRNNRVYIAGIPVFYWPIIRTSLNEPTYYVERLRVGNDNVFGSQVIVGLNMYQLLGWRNPPRGTKWIGDIGYLSERGPVLGSEYDYRVGSLFGLPGDVRGNLRSWYVRDSGFDNLGRERRKVPLEERNRGRIRWTHQHLFSNTPGLRFQGEVGWLSDRNFLEQYFEREWDTSKDYRTGATLLRNWNNQSFQLQANYQLNDFVTETSWLPRFDHYILGQSVFGTRLVWHGRSHVGYGRFRAAEFPENPVDAAKFAFLPWETADATGLRAGTRHELDLPLQVGAVRVTPYVLGDVTYWEEDLLGNDLTRLYGQAGIRASLPMWRIDPTVHSVLLNLNGLAHKVTWDAEVLYADANQNFDTLPLYDPLHDDSQEAFQRRFILDVFGGALPPKFDERLFAHRSLIQSHVSSPTAEIADDLAAVKLGMRNRWQTKRGLPGDARIIDLVEFDIQGTYFPDSARDNFGTHFGLLNYDFAWHIGDRLSVVSDGFYDVFGQGLRTTAVGVHATRPAVGNWFVGVRSIEGPISSNILNTQVAYRMSDKWILRAGSSFDFSSAGNIGQSVNVVRVGESFLVRLGVNFNASRDNVGVLFGIEPRFATRPRLGMVGGQPILPASTMFLE